MASQKMMKSTIALFLTINLVFFGFTVAQAPAPQPAPVCPRNMFELLLCTNVLPLGRILNSQAILPCCNLVKGLSTPVASVCICNAFKLSVLSNTITTIPRINEILGVCGFLPTPDGFVCA